MASYRDLPMGRHDERALADARVVSELIAALAENLERHVPTLDLTDENARRERDAYQRLSQEQRAIAEQLRATAEHMESYRDLPMARHDESKLADPRLIEAFQEFVRVEEELLDLLGKSLARDRPMIAALSR